MPDRRVFPAALLAVAFALGPSTILLSQSIQRSMYVSVVDQTGAPVPDLGPADFIVREDNVAREVLRVAPADDPMQIAILVDTSVAATSDIPHIREALLPFIDTLTATPGSGGSNQIAIIAVGERPTILTDYTSDRARLRQGVGRLWPQGANYLLNGLIEVTNGLKKRGATRPVIVALTTEGPEFSQRYRDLVLTPLRESGAVFHAIVLGSPSGDISDDAQNRDFVLAEGPRSTGGTRETLLTGMALASKLQQLANVLTHEYRVVYARPDSLIPPERTTVSAKRPELTARGRVIKEPPPAGRQGRP
jgi:hypothetical protein